METDQFILTPTPEYFFLFYKTPRGDAIPDFPTEPFRKKEEACAEGKRLKLLYKKLKPVLWIEHHIDYGKGLVWLNNCNLRGHHYSAYYSIPLNVYLKQITNFPDSIQNQINTSNYNAVMNRMRSGLISFYVVHKKFRSRTESLKRVAKTFYQDFQMNWYELSTSDQLRIYMFIETYFRKYVEPAIIY